MVVSLEAPATRPSLLVRLGDARDDAAWQAFDRAYGPLIYAHCRRCGLQDADAAEISQDVLLDVLRVIGRFRYDRKRGTFRAYLGMVTRRRLIRFWRRRQLQHSWKQLDHRQLAECLHDHRTHWDEDVDAHLLEQAMQRVEPRVEPETWKAFVRVWVRDEPPADVARQLERDVQWVYVAKSRILRKLQQEVAHLMRDLALE